MPTACSLKRTSCRRAPGGMFRTPRPAWGLRASSVPIMGSFFSSWVLQTQSLGPLCLSSFGATALSSIQGWIPVHPFSLAKYKESVTRIRLVHVSLHLTLVRHCHKRSTILNPKIQKIPKHSKLDQGVNHCRRVFVKGQWGDKLRNTTPIKSL